MIINRTKTIRYLIGFILLFCLSLDKLLPEINIPGIPSPQSNLLYNILLTMGLVLNFSHIKHVIGLCLFYNLIIQTNFAINMFGLINHYFYVYILAIILQLVILIVMYFSRITDINSSPNAKNIKMTWSRVTIAIFFLLFSVVFRLIGKENFVEPQGNIGIIGLDLGMLLSIGIILRWKFSSAISALLILVSFVFHISFIKHTAIAENTILMRNWYVLLSFELLLTTALIWQSIQYSLKRNAR